MLDIINTIQSSNFDEQAYLASQAEIPTITVIHLDENNVVKNFISVVDINDMPNCVEWQDGVKVGDVYDPDTQTFIPTPAPKIVPQSVTMRQARLALLGAGLLSQVDAAIESLDDPVKTVAQIEWQFSSSVERNRQLVNVLGPLLGLSEDELDDLFIEAAKL
jgi:hypothetical protein